MIYRIYKVVSSRNTNDVYIGSTLNALWVRLSLHKSDAKHLGHKNSKTTWVLENYDNLSIIEIGRVNSEKDALQSEEAEIIMHMEQGYNVLNTVYPTTKRKIFASPDLQLKQGEKPSSLQRKRAIDPTITYQEQYRKCNKPSCKTCETSKGHGPYWYAYWREDGKLRSAYVGKEKREYTRQTN